MTNLHILNFEDSAHVGAYDMVAYAGDTKIDAHFTLDATSTSKAIIKVEHFEVDGELAYIYDESLLEPDEAYAPHAQASEILSAIERKLAKNITVERGVKILHTDGEI